MILWISFIPQFPLKRNRPENSIFIAFDKVSSEVLLSLSPGCPESLLGDNNNIKKVTFRFNTTNIYNSCTNLSLWCQVMQRCVLEYPKVMICHSFFFLQNTSCIRKPQVISGGGVRTPCTLPLDPPLRCYISCMTHAKILVILVFQSGRENQRATRAMPAMRRNRVLRNCKCMKNVSCLVPRFC